MDREDRESDAISKDGVEGRREKRFRTVSRQSKIACGSVVNVEVEFLCLKGNVLSHIVYALPALLCVLDPSIKHRVASGAESRISIQ